MTNAHSIEPRAREPEVRMSAVGFRYAFAVACLLLLLAGCETEPPQPEPAPEPEPPALPAPEPEPDVEPLLEQARLAFEAHRLTTPEENSAYALYQEVLRLHPGNDRARRGLERIVERYVRFALDAVERGQFARARSMLARARLVDASHPAIEPTAQQLQLVENAARPRGARGPRRRPGRPAARPRRSRQELGLPGNHQRAVRCRGPLDLPPAQQRRRRRARSSQAGDRVAAIRRTRLPGPARMSGRFGIEFSPRASRVEWCAATE